MSDISKDLENLNKALEATHELQPGPALNTTDLTQMADPYLTDAAKTALAKKSTSQVIVDNGEAYVSVYLCAMSIVGEEEEAVKELAGAVNLLVEKGLVHSALARFSSVRLAEMPRQHPGAVVLVFPLVPAKREQEARDIAGSYLMREGEMPDPSILDKTLPEGQFFADIRVWSLDQAPKDEKGYFDSDKAAQIQVEQYLKVLPEGTFLVSCHKKAITDLSVPYEVIFSNPLLPSIKEVSLQHIRHLERVRGEVKQMNLLVGVEYTTRDDKKIKF
jgi:hypothetical protein